jgi:hypothetical protein
MTWRVLLTRPYKLVKGGEGARGSRSGEVEAPGEGEVGEQLQMARAARGITLGRAVQVHPMRPTLKAPGSKRLKLKYGEPLSNYAFNFNLRRYTSAPCPSTASAPGAVCQLYFPP